MTDIRDKGLVKNVSNKFVDDNEGSLLRHAICVKVLNAKNLASAKNEKPTVEKRK